ncbi:MAG: HAD family phosphatase [bacterium]|nr:HAD family phosphatase [bacterium]
MILRAIIFDMDGVLVDSETAIEAGLRVILRETHGFELTPDIFQQFFIGRTHQEGYTAFQEAYPDINVPLVREKSLGKYQELIGKEITLFPQAHETMQRALSVAALALATSSQRWQLEALDEEFGFLKHFSVVVSSDDITHSKPHPEIYQKTIERLAIPVEDCLAIEDTVAGVQSAKAAGLACWAVTHTTAREKLSAADAVFDSLEQLNFDSLT